jgi:Tfp pilus assembly protein FimV
VLVRADGRLGREGRLLRTLVGLVVLAGALALAPRAFAASMGEPEPTRPYVVSEGDTLWGIAGTEEPDMPRDSAVAAIMRLNAMSDTSLRPGEQILVPAES